MSWLYKIVELVDRDIAAHSKPLSMVGAAVPFVPFMLFVGGAPADKAPFLSGVAISVSFAWLAFVAWRVIRRTKNEWDRLREPKLPNKDDHIV